MSFFLVPLLLGFVFGGASAFTAAYSRRLGERGGQLITAVLRNVLGIPLWVIGYLWAWRTTSPWVLTPRPAFTTLGWLLVGAGLLPVAIGHIYVGMRSHLPSIRDTLVRNGLYAYVRHPIYAGGLVMLPGFALVRPTQAVLLASGLMFLYLIVQARLEEKDLSERIPTYQDYMRGVPRFVPHFLPHQGRVVK